MEQQDCNPADLTGSPFPVWSREASDYAWSLVPKSGLAATFVVMKRGDINRIKRVINGKSYNTMTATFIAVNLPDVTGLFLAVNMPYATSDSLICTETLWQTKSGDLFMVLEALSGQAVGHCKILVLPVTQEEAMEWGECLRDVMREAVRAALVCQPHDREPTRSMTLRLPPALVDRINKAAHKEGVSRSVWMMRKLEHAVSENPQG